MDSAVREIPAFAISIVIAELFFKFGSFTAEAIAFAVLWRGLVWVQHRLFSRL